MLPHLIALLLAVASNGETLTGKVVKVADGDTLTILVETTQYKIRLHGIDAPEKKQAFGTKAKQPLADKVFGQTVTVPVKDKDRYGRTVGVVLLGNRNINLEMAKEGLAWRYTRYDKRREYADAEAEARKGERGLWADLNPRLPWEW